MLTKPNFLRLFTYIVFFAAALYFPVRTVLNFERPAVPPVEMRFKLRAYDPYDPMRGHYLQLNVDCPAEIRMEQNEYFDHYNLKYAAELKPGPDGFAVATGLFPVGKTPKGALFVKGVKIPGAWVKGASDRIVKRVEMPFDRFYLNEPLAKPAEKLLGEVTRDPKRSAVLVVDIHRDGSWAVKELLVDGKPIREALRAAAK